MILIVTLVSITVFCFVYVIFQIYFAKKILIESRLNKLKTYGTSNRKHIDQILQQSFVDRIIKPLLDWLSTITHKFTPLKKREVMVKRLDWAGNPRGLSASEFISLQYAISITMGVLAYILSYANNTGVSIQVLSVIWGLAFGYFSLDTLLKVKISNRQANIEKELPNVLDLITISVEAGLGFDAALQKVIQKFPGVISEQFNTTLQEIRIGKTRKNALRDLGTRTGVDDLNTFIGAIIQADQLGVSIGNVLRTQSERIRVLRKQRIEEQAMKAPIKMLFPLIFFIFPTIFIVIIGPAVIQVIENTR